jgi:hypothetical protein
MGVSLTQRLLRSADQSLRSRHWSACRPPPNAEVLAAQAANQPTSPLFSVDAKKKELVGNYRNGGTDYRPKGDPNGSLRSGDFRLWPQTERIKAEVRRSSHADEGTAAAFTALFRHIDGVRPGLWRERISADGTSASEPAPATSLYHLTAALTDPAVTAHANRRG